MRAKILNASAGSGKTYALAYKYIHDVLGNCTESGGFDASVYRHIVAVTFTNKATGEMKSRILRQIQALASGWQCDYTAALMADLGIDEQELRRRAKIVRTAILHDYSHFTILTNDTFFQRILRAFVKELGIDLSYSIELDTATILTKSADAIIEDIADNGELREWVMEMAQDRIEEGERWNVREGILLLNRELFKEYTKEPISRAADKKQLKKTVFAYAAQVEKIVEDIKSLARTAVQKIADSGYVNKDFSSGFTKYFDDVATTGPKLPSSRVMSHIDDNPEAWFAKARKATPQMVALAAELQPILAELCSRCTPEVESMANSRNILLRNYRSFAVLNDLYIKCMNICKEENSMLLSETKHIIAEFISESDTPFIYEKVGNRFDHYMIDEFQDTSFGEWRNFLPLLRNAMSQSRQISVLLVGDIKQSIYRWRGSDWSILGSVAPADLGEENVDIQTLECNYRSLPRIVHFNNEVVGRAVEIDNEALNTRLAEAVAGGKIVAEQAARLQDTLRKAYTGLTQTPKRKSRNEGYVNVTVCEEEPDIVGRIKELIDRGYRPCDITILVRSKAESYYIAEQLLSVKEEGDARYRIDVMTQEALKVNNSSAVRLILAMLRLAINRGDTISRAIYNRYLKSGDFSAQISDEESAFLDSLRTLSPEEAFESVVMHCRLGHSSEKAYIQALHEQVIRFCAGKVADIGLFLRWWDEKGNDKSITVERSDSAIEIMTIHKAKGLENKVVLIPHCSWALDPKSDSGRIKSIFWAKAAERSSLSSLGTFPVPVSKAAGDSAFAGGYYYEVVYSHVDSVNLLYVALTRAAEQMYVFIPKSAIERGANVGRLVYYAIGAENFKECGNGITCHEYGTPEPPEPSKHKPSESGRIYLDEYLSSPVNMRLRLSASRYFDDGEQVRLSARNTGIMLHRAFENASTRKDILSAIEQMQIDGTLSTEEATALSNRITDMLDNSIAGEWFGDKWQTVRREESIIVPEQGLLRPDRVMITGNEAVVVDYKFGAKKNAHTRQVCDYARLLERMGYAHVRGYIWYVRDNEIVECYGGNIN